MEEIPLEEHARAARAPVDEDLGEKSCQFKGIRKRKWGSWVSEIRMPRSREKLWLGSYTTAEQAARAYDAAVYCLRGPNSISNFPDSVPSIPSASSLSRNQIQLAAARYATSLDQLPSISTSAHNDIENGNANNNKEATEDSVSPSRSASVQETVPLSDSRHQQEQDLVLWESLLAESDDYLTQNVERLPSIDEASALNLIPSWEEEEINNCLQITDLWNFGDV